MAYMSQDKKKELTPKIKEFLNKYGMKGSISVLNHSRLLVTLQSGRIDFLQYINPAFKDRHNIQKNNDILVNVYAVNDMFEGVANQFLNELINAMNNSNHDNSDIMTDYFDVGWYIDIKIGNYDKDYIVI